MRNNSAPESREALEDIAPGYRFTGDQPPAALTHLRDEPRWVCWKYEQREDRWTKPPIEPRTGRYASVSNPNTWAPFDVALAGMERHGLAGIGLMLVDQGEVIGIDLDNCVTDSGLFTLLAAEVLSYQETYAEFSPSGEGIRLFGLYRLMANRMRGYKDAQAQLAMNNSKFASISSFVPSVRRRPNADRF